MVIDVRSVFANSVARCTTGTTNDVEFDGSRGFEGAILVYLKHKCRKHVPICLMIGKCYAAACTKRSDGLLRAVSATTPGFDDTVGTGDGIAGNDSLEA